MGKITYKIDRLLSGSDGLQLGLKTNVALKPTTLDQSTKYLQITSLAGYAGSLGTFTSSAGVVSDWGDFVESSSSPYATNKNLLTTAAWVEGLTAVRIAYILKYLETSFIFGDGHISIESHAGNSILTPKKTISLVPLYNGSGETATTVGGTKVHTVAPKDDSENDVAHGTPLDSSTKFITGFETDEYGKVTKVYGRKVSTADIGSLTNVDNYRSWGLRVSGYQNPVQIESAYANKDANEATITSLTLGGGAAIAAELDAANKVVRFNLQINADDFTTDGPSQGQTQINLKTFESVEQTTLGLYKIKLDTKGRVTESAAVQSSDLSSILPVFATNTAGIVSTRTQANTANAANSMYFLNSAAQWVQLPYDKVQVNATETNKHYSLLGVTGFSSSGMYVTATKTNAYFDNDGTIYGTFAGDGSALTNIVAGNIVAGSGTTINSDLINISTLKPKLGISASLGAGQIMITNGDSVMTTLNNTITAQTSNQYGYAVLSANMNANDGISDIPGIGWRNLKSLVSDVVAGEGGMRFQGVIGNGQGETSWANVEAGFKKGDFYKVGTIVSGWGYSGYASDLEAGDTMIALKDKDNSYATASDDDKKKYWSVIQGNLTNAVTGSTGTLSNNTYNVPVANDNTMTRIFSSFTATKGDSGWLLNATAQHAQDAETIKTARTLWGQSFNGSQNVAGNMTDVGIITPASSDGADTPTIGTSSQKWSAAYIDKIHGDLIGEASRAAQLTRPLILTFGNNTFTFDGSATDAAARTFSFDTDNLNIFDDFENAAATGNGNVITGVTLSRKATDNSTLVLTPAKGITAVTDISSTLLSVTGTGATKTIGAHSSNQGADKLHFYTGSTLPSNTTILNLQGKLEATTFIVAGDSTESTKAAHEVANKRPQTAKLDAIDQTKKILVADTNSGDYSFIQSTVAIKSQAQAGNWAGADDVTIPTQSAIKSYVDNTATAISAATKVECLAITFMATNNSWAVSEGKEMPAGAVIDHIDVVVETSFQAEAGFYLVNYSESSNTNSIISPDEIDLSTTGGDVFSYKFGRQVKNIVPNIPAGGIFRPKINLTGLTTTQGTGVCYIYYTKAQVV